MRDSGSAGLALLLAAGIHVDWHLARPAHHRLSLDWSYHWVFSALLFACVAALVAVRWQPPEHWRAGAWVLLLGVSLAQIVEPVLTLAYYEQRLAYDVGPERWRVFIECLAAGLPAYTFTLWCVARSRSTARTRSYVSRSPP